MWACSRHTRLVEYIFRTWFLTVVLLCYAALPGAHLVRDATSYTMFLVASKLSLRWWILVATKLFHLQREIRLFHHRFQMVHLLQQSRPDCATSIRRLKGASLVINATLLMVSGSLASQLLHPMKITVQWDQCQADWVAGLSLTHSVIQLQLALEPLPLQSSVSMLLLVEPSLVRMVWTQSISVEWLELSFP